MVFDLEGVKAMHPRLSEETCHDLAQKAAHALQRHHQPGVSLALEKDTEDAGTATLSWRRRDDAGLQQLDHVKVTEEGAEAIALCFVHRAEGWRVRRRLQRDDFADFLLEMGPQRLALEVSGTDIGSLRGRMKAKLENVAKARYANRAACVVRFAEPRAVFQRVHV